MTLSNKKIEELYSKTILGDRFLTLDRYEPSLGNIGYEEAIIRYDKFYSSTYVNFHSSFFRAVLRGEIKYNDKKEYKDKYMIKKIFERPYVTKIREPSDVEYRNDEYESIISNATLYYYPDLYPKDRYDAVFMPENYSTLYYNAFLLGKTLNVDLLKLIVKGGRYQIYSSIFINTIYAGMLVGINEKCQINDELTKMLRDAYTSSNIVATTYLSDGNFVPYLVLVTSPKKIHYYIETLYKLRANYSEIFMYKIYEAIYRYFPSKKLLNNLTERFLDISVNIKEYTSICRKAKENYSDDELIGIFGEREDMGRFLFCLFQYLLYSDEIYNLDNVIRVTVEEGYLDTFTIMDFASIIDKNIFYEEDKVVSFYNEIEYNRYYKSQFKLEKGKRYYISGNDFKDISESDYGKEFDYYLGITDTSTEPDVELYHIDVKPALPKITNEGYDPSGDYYKVYLDEEEQDFKDYENLYYGFSNERKEAKRYERARQKIKDIQDKNIRNLIEYINFESYGPFKIHVNNYVEDIDMYPNLANEINNIVYYQISKGISDNFEPYVIKEILEDGLNDTVLAANYVNTIVSKDKEARLLGHNDRIILKDYKNISSPYFYAATKNNIIPELLLEDDKILLFIETLFNLRKSYPILFMYKLLKFMESKGITSRGKSNTFNKFNDVDSKFNNLALGIRSEYLDTGDDTLLELIPTLEDYEDTMDRALYHIVKGIDKGMIGDKNFVKDCGKYLKNNINNLTFKDIVSKLNYEFCVPDKFNVAYEMIDANNNLIKDYNAYTIVSPTNKIVHLDDGMISLGHDLDRRYVNKGEFFDPEFLSTKEYFYLNLYYSERDRFKIEVKKPKLKSSINIPKSEVRRKVGKKVVEEGSLLDIPDYLLFNGNVPEYKKEKVEDIETNYDDYKDKNYEDDDDDITESIVDSDEDDDITESIVYSDEDEDDEDEDDNPVEYNKYFRRRI